MEQLITKKLYYGKWPYKIECRLPHASHVIRLGIPETIRWASNSRDYYWLDKKQADKKDMLNFAVTIEKFASQDIQIRSEGNHFNIFCKDKDLLDSMVLNLKKWVFRVVAPANDKEKDFLLDNSRRTVICNQLPFDKFQFKMFIKESMSIDQREKFLNWIEKYPEKIKISGTSYYWLKGSRMWMQDPFIHVLDEKMMSMILLYLGNHSKRINEFIPRSSINT